GGMSRSSNILIVSIPVLSALQDAGITWMGMSNNKKENAMKKWLMGVLTLMTLSANLQAETIRNVVYGQKDGLAMVLDVYKPDSGANGAGIAYMISGGWMSSLTMRSAYESMFMPLVNAGYTVFAVRHGSSPRYNVLEAWSDVSQAFQFIGNN